MTPEVHLTFLSTGCLPGRSRLAWLLLFAYTLALDRQGTVGARWMRQDRALTVHVSVPRLQMCPPFSRLGPCAQYVPILEMCPVRECLAQI